jgi:hypothetical protein
MSRIGVNTPVLLPSGFAAESAPECFNRINRGTEFE